MDEFLSGFLKGRDPDDPTTKWVEWNGRQYISMFQGSTHLGKSMHMVKGSTFESNWIARILPERFLSNQVGWFILMDEFS